jgi:tape measure domain-containing protein
MTEEFRINITAADKTKAAIASAERSLEGFRASALNVSGALSGIAGALTVREIASMADSYQNIQARLKLATKDAEEFAAANENIKRIALSSQNPLESTATLYTRISQSLLDVGGTQQQVANTTQALALALRLSGATAGESASAMLQFSQAIGSGVLRGEEFNAVNEAAPRAMKALADALGVPIGKLRTMAEQGEITRDILVEALGSQLPKLLAEAETLPNTFGATFTSLRNQLLLMIGELDQYSGASGATAKAVGEAGRIALETIVVLGANVGFVFKGIYTEITGIGSQLVALSKLDFDGFTSIGDRMKKEAAAARKELDDFEQRILNPKKPKEEAIATDKGAADRLQSLLTEAQAQAKAAAAAKAAEAAAKASANANKSALQTMQDRLFASQKLSEVERTNLDIQIGKYKDLTAASKQRLLEMAGQIDANNALNEAQKAQQERDKQITEEGIARFKALQEAGAAVYASTRTDAQQYSDEVIRLNDLLAQGAITQDTYNQAVLNAQDAYQKASGQAKVAGEEMSQYAIQAARNQQTAFAQFLFDPFQDGVKGMAAGFLNAIRQMAANAAAQHIFDSLFGKSGGDGGLLGSLFTSAIGAFTGTKKFASGGDFGGGLRLVGEQGPELEVTGPSRIFNANQTKAMLNGGGGDTIIVNNNFSLGVQQTVRAELIAMMPAIQRQTVAAVASAKKRNRFDGDS